MNNIKYQKVNRGIKPLYYAFHWSMVKIIIVIPININSCLYKWNHLISPVIIIKAPMAPIIGQGLFSTKWNGWLLCLVINLLL